MKNTCQGCLPCSQCSGAFRTARRNRHSALSARGKVLMCQRPYLSIGWQKWTPYAAVQQDKVGIDAWHKLAPYQPGHDAQIMARGLQMDLLDILVPWYKVFCGLRAQISAISSAKLSGAHPNICTRRQVPCRAAIALHHNEVCCGIVLSHSVAQEELEILFCFRFIVQKVVHDQGLGAGCAGLVSALCAHRAFAEARKAAGNYKDMYALHHTTPSLCFKYKIAPSLLQF